jgi:hypothetical protein
VADHRPLAVGLLALTLSACSTVAGTPSPSPDHTLVTGYFTQLDAAAQQGVQAEQRFLAATQVREFTDRLCDLGGVTISATPTLSTLRPDPGWTPPGSDKHVAGTIYVVAVTLSIRQGTAVVGNQIGSQRVVIAGGEAYSFAPCPAQ